MLYFLCIRTGSNFKLVAGPEGGDRDSTAESERPGDSEPNPDLGATATAGFGTGEH